MTKELLIEMLGDQTQELAVMHATLQNLITELRMLGLSGAQAKAVNEAWRALQQSQQRFFARYGDEIGGPNPERN